jgi:hypothetical protein
LAYFGRNVITTRNLSPRQWLAQRMPENPNRCSRCNSVTQLLPALPDVKALGWQFHMFRCPTCGNFDWITERSKPKKNENGKPGM